MAAMALLFIGAGYVWARWAGHAGGLRKSSAEQFLWSVAASLPIAIALCALAGRILGATGVVASFLILDAVAVVLWLRDRRGRANVSAGSANFVRWMLALMAAFGVYCVLELVDVQIGQRLYVSTMIADWSVRVPMVEAAMRSAAAGIVAPPINGLSTLTSAGFGHAPALRYYYFWYVLVAQVARPLHVSAQAALIASCAWAGWGLIAACLLALKYMAGLRDKLRQKSFVFLLMLCVLGLDILPTALLWLSSKLHPYPEMEYWHQDRTPSFLGAVLYAPHHIAAFCCLLVGFLALLLTMRSMNEKSIGTSRIIAAIAFAAVAFAAAAGTSLFPTFTFVFVLTIWAADLVRRKEFATLAALAASGLLALLLAHPYLRELGAGSSAAAGFVNLAWRNNLFLAQQQVRHHLLINHGAVIAALVRQPMVLVMDFFELGFYTFVLIAGVRAAIKRRRLTPGECALTALIAGAAIPAFFLTSTATSGPNDLGVDAGFVLRLGLQLAAVGWVWKLWHVRREQTHRTQTGPARWAQRFAVLLFALGLSAQVYQSASERLYYPVVGGNLVHKQIDTFTHDQLAARLYNIRSAYRQLDGLLPPSAPDTHAVQFNPVGVMQPAETLFADRQVASWDTGCGTSYGGEYKLCGPAFANLLFLYGNTPAGVAAGRAENDREDGAAPVTATVADFKLTCRALHVDAIVAESTDPAWQRQDSWVWTAPVLVQNETVRVFGCPR